MRPCGRARVKIHEAAPLKVAQLSCPVSIKTYTEEDWTGTVGHIVVWCASVLLLSLSRLCHITRVYVGFFILMCYTLCLCPFNAVWVLCLCCRVRLNFVSPFNCVYSCSSLPYGPPPWQIKAHTAIQKRACLRKHSFLHLCTYQVCLLAVAQIMQGLTEPSMVPKSVC